VTTKKPLSKPEARRRLITTNAYADMCGEGRTSPWQRARRDPAAPQPMYLGPRTVRWDLDAIELFIAKMTATKRAARPEAKGAA
jgi:predicted DNA-binding transcriptional regulator AlpA